MVIQFYSKKDKPTRAKQYLPKYGYSLYLPRKQLSGEGLGEIFNWLSTNSAAIKDLTSAGSNTIQSLSKTAIDTARGITEIKNLRAVPRSLTESAQEKILASIPDRRSGNGFKIISG